MTTPITDTPSNRQSLLLTLSCPNQPGIVANVTTAIFRHGGDIKEAQQFDARDTGTFFTRIALDLANPAELPALRQTMTALAERYAMNWQMTPADRRAKVLLLASKFDHCLADLLYRWRTGELPMEVVGIISNHPRETYANLSFGEIPFHHLPVTKDAKPFQEARIKAIVSQTEADLVVLAR